MSFKHFYLGQPVEQRDAFAARAGTSRGLLTQVAYGNKRIELGLADVIVRLGAGAVAHEDLPLTDNATRQRAIRDGAVEVQATGP